MNLDAFNPKVDPPEQPIEGFTVICLKCAGTNIYLENNIRHGSEETGAWGDFEIICRKCGRRASIMSA